MSNMLSSGSKLRGVWSFRLYGPHPQRQKMMRRRARRIEERFWREDQDELQPDAGDSL